MRTWALVVAVMVSLTGFATAGLAKTCELEISGTDAMQYNKKKLTIAADCTEVKLTLTHAGKLPKSAMGHNWVLAATSDMAAVVAAGAKAGLAKGYVNKSSDKVIAATDLVGGGETASTTFKVSELKKGTDYTFFCTFPGHSAMMQGKFVVKGSGA